MKFQPVSGVELLQPYQPGKPIETLERELGISDSVKLASNENPLGPSEHALNAARVALNDLTLYPDASAYRLKAALSERFGLHTEQLTLGNGSNELLELIARVFVSPGDEVIFSEYSFIVYPIVARACGARSVVVPAKAFAHDLTAIAQCASDQTRLIYLANPNNPTGTHFTVAEFEQFMSRVPSDTLVVLDEAYSEYSEQADPLNGLNQLSRYSNLIVTRTFSKAWGLAGLRVGFAAASSEITDLLNRVRQPFNVNSIALIAAEAVLGDEEYLERSIQINRAGKQQLFDGLRELHIDWIPTDANFVTIDLKEPALPIYSRLLEQGVIVRPLDAYGMPNHLRVSIGLASENQRFLAALAGALI